MEVDYEEWQGYGRARTIPRQPTVEEQAAIEALTERQEALEAQLEASEDDDETETLEAQYAALEAESDALHAALESPDPEDVAVAGAIVTLDQNGQIDIRRGLIRPADRKPGHSGAMRTQANPRPSRFIRIGSRGN